MAKFRIETQITLLAVIIAAAVITSGYFAYKSLSEIVNSVHREARPDNKLFLIKDISADLQVIENNVRMYVLSGDVKDLKSYDSIQVRISQKIETLNEMIAEGNDDYALVDSFSVLALEKLALWQRVLNLHKNKLAVQPDFSELYSKLEEPQFDTIQVETEKKGILRKIFGGKKTVVDTTIVEHDIEKEDIRNQIQELESEMVEKGQQSNQLESDLIAGNIEISGKITRLIAQAEKNEVDGLMAKTQEADRLAGVTYKRLAAFSVTAVVLLLVVLFLLHNYLKKSKSYQRALKRAREEAENLALAKEKFAANVSHEMRTPANAIYGLAEQLLHRRNNDDINEQISVLAQSARHLNSIINDTLDFSKLQAGKLKLENVHFSPAKVFDEVLALEKYTATKKGIALNSGLAHDIPVALVGDPLRLKQILINLISNAIKFTERGEVKFTAWAEPMEEKQFRLHMQVSDTGIGITRKDLDIIFEEFVQAENQAGKKYSGTGLGLAIVKKLVELQGGHISIESQPGNGTTVKVNIPYGKGKKSKIEEQRFEVPEVPEHYSELQILVADDEEFNRFLFRGIFNKWRVKIKEAVNGEEVVKMALNQDFDLILMDMRMPKMNGIEATKAILKAKPGTKIIAITATSDKTEKEACRAAGMLEFLPKPFSERNLFDVVNKVVKFSPKEQKADNKPVIDIAELERMMNGDTVFMKEMIELFIRSAETGIEKLKTATVENDWATVFEVAHKLAPQSKHLRAADLYQQIKKLELAASTVPVNHQEILKLIMAIEEELTDINFFLRKYLDETSKNKDISFPPQLKN